MSGGGRRIAGAARPGVRPSRALARVERGDLCSGCGACAGAVAPGKIVMGEREGWLRPVQTAPLTAEEDAAFARVCPGLTLEQDARGRRDDVLWGPVVAARTGWATDPALRRNASSGGGLSALLVHLLESGAVDDVLQITADPERPIGNLVVRSRTPEEIFAAAGSRYAPSAPLAHLAERLDEPGRSAFVGKPCDVGALRSLARRDSRVAEKFPYVLSFFCAGVPSLAGARRILSKLDVEEPDLVAFRYRGDGWPGFAIATTRDGGAARLSYAQSWGAVLSKHLQFRCKVCPDGVGGFADVVCADAWECDERGYPIFEEREGVSLLLSRTERGEALVGAALAANRLEASPFDLAGLAQMQPGQFNKKRLALSRLAALAATGGTIPRFTGFNLARAARQAGVAKNLRSFLGTVRRRLAPSGPDA